MRIPFNLIVLLLLLGSCSVQRQMAKTAKAAVLNHKALQAAHVGISIYDPAAGKYLYNYQGDKYFVPASNAKIPTCYAAMKYLGDSLVGLRYGIPEETGWKDKVVVIQPTGDPSFLHHEFKRQVVFDSLVHFVRNRNRLPGILLDETKIERWGNGWSWNDFEATYMAERSRLPIFGNVLDIGLNDSSKWVGEEVGPGQFKSNLFKTQSNYFDTLLNRVLKVRSRNNITKGETLFSLERPIGSNDFQLKWGKTKFKNLSIPFVTNDFYTAIQILADTLDKSFSYAERIKDTDRYSWLSDNGDLVEFTIRSFSKIHSQPTDSLLKPMMHRSDNFFAEQSLLMVSHERLGVMDDGKIIDTLLQTDLKDLPQKPRWADGSGLSRYNLFTPQDLVMILYKMKNEFGMDRLKVIFPTGGEGTISSYYRNMKGSIFGKTGTLSGVVAFSGFLYTKKGKLLIFSTLVNNHQGTATDVRRAVEKFLTGIRERY